MIGEERLLHDVDLNPHQKAQPAVDTAPSSGLAHRLAVTTDRTPAGIGAVEAEASNGGYAEIGEFDEIGHERPQRALAGDDSNQESQPMGADIPGARTRRRSSRPRSRDLGTAGGFGIAVAIATGVTILLVAGASGPNPPDRRAGRQGAEPPGLLPGLGRADRVEPRGPTVSGAGGGDGTAQAPGSAGSAPSTMAEPPTEPVPTAPRPVIPESSPALRSTRAPAREAGPAVVQREFGP